jgi:hypothetical protein
MQLARLTVCAIACGSSRISSFGHKSPEKTQKKLTLMPSARRSPAEYLYVSEITTLTGHGKCLALTEVPPND